MRSFGRSRLTGGAASAAPPHVALAEGDVGRVFLGCYRCRRVMPHWRAYATHPTPTDGVCRCGATHFRPVRIPEWQAAIWVLVVGWLWRKTIRGETQWDPRMPVRQRPT